MFDGQLGRNICVSLTANRYKTATLTILTTTTEGESIVVAPLVYHSDTCMSGAGERFGDVTYAVFYFISGVTFCGVNLMCISAIPDCSGYASPQHLKLLAALLFACAIAVIPSTFFVPFIIGIEGNVSERDQTTRICAFVLRFALVAVSLFYMLTTMQRNIESFFPSLSIFSECTISISLMLVVILAFIDSVVFTRSDIVLCFDAIQLVWVKPEMMLLKDQIVAIVFLVITLLLYTIVTLYIVVEHYSENVNIKVDNGSSVLNDLTKMSFYFFFDLIFIMLNSFFYTSTTDRNTFRFITLNNALFGYLQSFGQSLWPTICALTFCTPLRKALIRRLRLMMGGDRISKRQSRLRSQQLRKMTIRASASPVFQLFAKSQKGTTKTGAMEETGVASVANNIGSLHTVPIFVLRMGT
ncbi:hypothetical protein Tcan_07318 [Toxocara canis]|uniref:Uncharacterized protein n=1 Tax=Toxocara canis TaxID=6265 RepID=A0A0B2V8I6_TOXCA|nr:hypothetical protein Tcan_07318 [Toxocara canis]